MERKLNFRLSERLYQRAVERARREHVNLSALLREMLIAWVEGKYVVQGVQDRTETE